MCAVRSETDRRAVPRQGRRGFLADVAAAVLVLPFLQWGRNARAQQVYYDQYGQPVQVAPGTVVTPVAPAYAAPPPGYASYGPTGVVGQSRRVARRTSRRTGRREDVREDIWD